MVAATVLDNWEKSIWNC